jgi:aspartate/methionine/tyrosine aminotransferase
MKKIIFNRRIQNVKSSASIDLMDKARTLKEQGNKIISLAGGEPDFDTPEYAAKAGVQAINNGYTHYSNGRGIIPFRQRIAKKLIEENNIQCTEQEILVTPGGKFAIYCSLYTLLNPDDEVLVFRPAWVSYAPMVSLCGGIPVYVPLIFDNNYEITKELLDQVVTKKTRLIILNTPNNPTGRVLTKHEAEILSNFVLEHDLIVIADEIYEKIIFDGRQHISLASNPILADKIITINGMSKSAAMTGWRIGYLCANKSIVDKIYMIYQHTLTCISEFSQIAAIEALNHPESMAEMCESYRERRDFWCNRMLAIPSITCNLPEGAFYAWMRIDKDGMSSEQMSTHLLEKAGVVVVPGEAYGETTNCCIRASFATSMEELRQAADRMEQVLNE